MKSRQKLLVKNIASYREVLSCCTAEKPGSHPRDTKAF